MVKQRYVVNILTLHKIEPVDSSLSLPREDRGISPIGAPGLLTLGEDLFPEVLELLLVELEPAFLSFLLVHFYLPVWV